jgi:hypothetical protein
LIILRDNGINIQTTLPSNVAAGDWFLMKFSARQVTPTPTSRPFGTRPNA